MAVDVHIKPRDISPARFFADLQCIATYVFKQGLPFFVSSHIKFMKAYLKAWGEQGGDEEAVNIASEALKAFIKDARHNLNPILFLVTGFVNSVASSAWLTLSKSIRIVPPLITAVVVVFVASDSWRFLGTGFTPRFFCLVTLFLLSSLLFLIRFKGYWEKDFDVDESDVITVEGLLDKLEHGLRSAQEAVPLYQRLPNGVTGEQQHDANDASTWEQFNELVGLGAKPFPFVKPANLGFRICHYCAYVAVSLLSLIVVALAVSASLILVGVILITAEVTKDLAQSVYIYWMLPGHFVITRQLVSLSLSLGAFATLFVVAGQRTEDRKELMDSALALIRTVFIAYSVYGRAHDHAVEWTRVPVKSPPLAPEAQEPGHHSYHSAPHREF
jgi:hypothetical protein